MSSSVLVERYAPPQFDHKPTVSKSYAVTRLYRWLKSWMVTVLPTNITYVQYHSEAVVADLGITSPLVLCPKLEPALILSYHSGKVVAELNADGAPVPLTDCGRREALFWGMSL